MMKKLATIVGAALLGAVAIAATATPSAASPWSHHIAACEANWGWHYNPRTNLVSFHGSVFPCDWRAAPPPVVILGPAPGPFGWHHHPWFHHPWYPHPWHRW
jgi:opacity protein-like surface antigen